MPVLTARALILSVILATVPDGGQQKPEIIYLYASHPGRTTLDRDAEGGNPFATAVIQLLSRKELSFTTFAQDLVLLTRAGSNGWQEPQVIGGGALDSWQFLPKPAGESRIALIVIFSAYDHSEIGASLPGARHDASRIAKALTGAGFHVESVLNPNPAILERKLSEFGARSARTDVALIYTTGHGREENGLARILLPYARSSGRSELTVHELSRSLRAKRANLLFYAACR
jgi:hypothetical protein